MSRARSAASRVLFAIIPATSGILPQLLGGRGDQALELVAGEGMALAGAAAHAHAVHVLRHEEPNLRPIRLIVDLAAGIERRRHRWNDSVDFSWHEVSP